MWSSDLRKLCPCRKFRCKHFNIQSINYYLYFSTKRLFCLRAHTGRYCKPTCQPKKKNVNLGILFPSPRLTSQPLTSFMISCSLAFAACCLRYASRSPSANKSGTRCNLDQIFSRSSSLIDTVNTQSNAFCAPISPYLAARIIQEEIKKAFIRFGTIVTGTPPSNGRKSCMSPWPPRNTQVADNRKREGGPTTTYLLSKLPNPTR